MNETARAVRVALTILCPLFRLLPGEFRRRNAAELRAVLEDRLAEVLRERGMAGLVNRWFREAVDIAVTAARLHFADADERALARARNGDHPSIRPVQMNQHRVWQRAPRAAGVACAFGATGLGMLFMVLAGAPDLYLAVNGLALVMGLAAVALAWTSRKNRPLPGAVILFLGFALLATALFGVAADGAARWIRVGGMSMQVSLIAVPVMLVSFAQRRDRYSTLGIVVAALALAVQPDRAMAGILMCAVAVLSGATRDPRALLALGSAATGFAATLLRSDGVPAVPFVDSILYTSFDVGLAAGLAVTGGALLLVVPAWAGWRYDPDHREVYAVFGVIWLGAIVAAAIGNYPTPVVGYGGSAVLGYSLSIALIPPKLRHAAAEAQVGGVGIDRGEVGADLRPEGGGRPFHLEAAPS